MCIKHNVILKNQEKPTQAKAINFINIKILFSKNGTDYL
jgi:hypothetical protein